MKAPVTTRGGFQAIIIAVDVPNERPIVGYVLQSNGHAVFMQWDKQGKLWEAGKDSVFDIRVPINVEQVQMKG